MSDIAVPQPANPSWARVQLARHPKRPHALDYMQRLFTNLRELHGDRTFSDDHAIVAGMGWLGEQPLMIVAQQKGHNTKQNVFHNFGMPRPEAYHGKDAEERGQGEAIAYNLREMSRLGVPVIVVVIGEGGSGGALALGV